MNNGLKIILARMDTNPEEFIEKHKWRHLVESEWPMFTKEEQEAYTSKLREILGDVFSQQILQVLMEDEKETMRYKASDRYAISGTEAALANKLNISLKDYAKIKKDMEKIK